MAPGRAAVVGGSVAGLLCAGALYRSGWSVSVHERTAGALEDRGAGVILPVAVHDRLVAGGWMGGDTGAVPITRRQWLVADPGAGPSGRVVWEHPLLGRTNNWGVLWRSLRAELPDVEHRAPDPVREVRPGWPPVLAGERGELRPDLVVGADGYRSTVRADLEPGARPSWSGYVLWRGTYDVSRAPADALALLSDGVLASPVHGGGHAVVYLVPDHGPGSRKLNWAMSGRLPASLRLPDQDPGAVPHGALDETFGTELERVLDEIPPLWAEVARATPPENRLVQPIYDHPPTTYIGPGVLLAGDAASVARPHTGSGVAKAAGDAFALERVLHEEPDLPAALAAYEEDRRPAGASMVRVGRRLGRATVEQPPDWAATDVPAMREWARTALGDTANYMLDPG